MNAILLSLFCIEGFECPSGFFKCTKSFCIEQRFVCDGRYHCEHEDDEKSCDMSCYIYILLRITGQHYKTIVINFYKTSIL